MKHTNKITIILVSMFLITQLFGIFVVGQYAPVTDEITNTTIYNLPYGLEPPEEVGPGNALISILIAIVFAVFLMFILMRYKVEIILRIWFFIVVALALAITLNSLILNIPSSAIIAIIVALPLSFFKIFKRNIIVHNITELGIYPGIATIFVPLFASPKGVWYVVALLILISIYDIYAVWHAGFMQKMAHYQINKVKAFAGFFIPYIGKKQKEIITKAQNSKSKKAKQKQVKVNVAILGGGDVLFPIILAGVVLFTLGLVQAVLISLGATAALTALFIFSQKGKFYPAMPFISAGCFVGLALAYLI
jgi:presenilin-like A22 family membrane protease